MGDLRQHLGAIGQRQEHGACAFVRLDLRDDFIRHVVCANFDNGGHAVLVQLEAHAGEDDVGEWVHDDLGSWGNWRDQAAAFCSLSKPITRSKQPGEAFKAPKVIRSSSNCFWSGTTSPHWLMAPDVTPTRFARASEPPAYLMASDVFMRLILAH